MAAYISIGEYAEMYGMPSVDPGAFPFLAQTASDIIDAATFYRVKNYPQGLAGFDPMTQELVKKACAAEILYLIENGGVDSVVGATTRQGFTVGKVRVDGEGRSAQSSREKRGVSALAPMAVILLEQTGLMYPAVCALC